MPETVWEGLIEVLRGDQPPLKATARLWRRDDFFGADWGGQLEAPVVFRRLLPQGEYEVRLPSGARGSARITTGPSTTSLTFPTLSGIGQPPFGNPEDHLLDDAALLDGQGPAAHPPATPPAAPARSTTRRIRRRAPSADPAAVAALAPVPVAAPAAEASAVAAPVPLPEAVPAPKPAPAPEPVAPPAFVDQAAVQSSPSTPSSGRARRAAPDLHPARHATPDGDEAAQTEAMARAFLACIESRSRLDALSRPGFEGRAVAAALQSIEAATTTLEGALRARAGTDHWSDEVAGHLLALSWFASLAMPDAGADIAAAGRAVQALVGTIESLLATSTVRRAQARAA